MPFFQPVLVNIVPTAATWPCSAKFAPKFVKEQVRCSHALHGSHLAVQKQKTLASFFGAKPKPTEPAKALSSAPSPPPSASSSVSNAKSSGGAAVVQPAQTLGQGKGSKRARSASKDSDAATKVEASPLKRANVTES